MDKRDQDKNSNTIFLPQGVTSDDDQHKLLNKLNWIG